MNGLQLLLLVLMAIVALNGIAKISDDLGRFRECLAAGSLEDLFDLLQENQLWIKRHFICALMGVGIIAYVKLSPALERFENLAGLAAVHVTLSLLFVFIESLFVHRISQELSSHMAPVRVNSRRSNRN